MDDACIRKALRKDIERTCWEHPDTLIIDELGLCQGIGRIDLAVVNDRLIGYEIKSNQDTLVRLPSQRRLYNRIFDWVTLVAGNAHIEKVLRDVPAWWGNDRGMVRPESGFLRGPASRGQPGQGYSVHVQLLWRDEALEVLKDRGNARGVLSKSKRYIWDRLVDTVPAEDLCEIVRNRLKSRKDWR